MNKDENKSIVKIEGVEINLDAVKGGNKNGSAMTKTQFMESMAIKTRIEDKDGKPQYTKKIHPKIEKIWTGVEKALKNG